DLLYVVLHRHLSHGICSAGTTAPAANGDEEDLVIQARVAQAPPPAHRVFLQKTSTGRSAGATRVANWGTLGYPSPPPPSTPECPTSTPEYPTEYPRVPNGCPRVPQNSWIDHFREPGICRPGAGCMTAEFHDFKEHSATKFKSRHSVVAAWAA